ncbi:MAG TPA: hypothetical protein VK669_08915 [Candidatus Limnocylindrales bacterium]|nr:hypothetical protein [Candidatus Limnocylindrales bacterium]
MSGFRRFGPAAVAVLSIVLIAGCGSDHRASTTLLGTKIGAHAHRPPPSDPDLTVPIERYYQFVEEGRWPYAYAMLSPRYRALLSEAQFELRYARMSSADVHARQVSPSTVVTRIDPSDAERRAGMRSFDETVRMTWDGEDWKIDRITRTR